MPRLLHHISVRYRMQFPDEALDGKYIPEMAFELG